MQLDASFLRAQIPPSSNLCEFPADFIQVVPIAIDLPSTLPDARLVIANTQSHKCVQWSTLDPAHSCHGHQFYDSQVVAKFVARRFFAIRLMFSFYPTILVGFCLRVLSPW